MHLPATRRDLLKGALAAGALAAAGARALAKAPPPPPTAKDTFGLRKQGKKIPVIYDSDIGDDIDDTWALAMLLSSPRIDLKLVVADNGNCVYRARIFAKMLEAFGRTDVPVGLGIHAADRPGRQSAWTKGYDLAKYPGTVHQDGVGAIVKTIQACRDPVTLVCVGPVQNIPAALKRDPSIVRKARFVGMHGSVRIGYGGAKTPAVEYNVRVAPKALQAVFAGEWDCTITPLDTCGLVHLTGGKFKKVHDSKRVGTRALMANYRAWAKSKDPLTRSSTLFDTVAVYLASSEALVKMEDIRLRVSDKGMTVPDKSGRIVHCATAWKDMGAFEDLLVERLTR